MVMLLAAAMLGLQAQTVPSPPEEIVVIRERMRRLKLETRTDRKTGSSKCVFKRRSGDPAFDTLMCDAVLTCARTVTTRSRMESCIAPRIDSYAREIARRRATRATDAAP